MRLTPLLLGSILPNLAQTVTIYATSYSGKLHTLSLTSSLQTVKGIGQVPTEIHDLKLLTSNSDCGSSPTWLTFDPVAKILYCLDEGITTPNGSLTSYSINTKTKALKHISTIKTLAGPVCSEMYGRDGSKEIHLAHYGVPGALSCHSAIYPDALTPLTADTFKLEKKGPVTDRQSDSHAHQVVIDPTGKFILVPDLGADMIRVIRHEAGQGMLTDMAPLKVDPGSGPRHAVFWAPVGLQKFSAGKDNLFLFVVSELANTLVSYQVSYNARKEGLAFKKVHKATTYGNNPIPEGAAAAEVLVGPDNKYIHVSNRGDKTFNVPNIDPRNATQQPSDSIATFTLETSGKFEFKQMWPAGGQGPRNMAVNARGDLVVVGLQNSERVVVLERNSTTGMLGSAVAVLGNLGPVTAVRWFEGSR